MHPLTTLRVHAEGGGQIEVKISVTLPPTATPREVHDAIRDCAAEAIEVVDMNMNEDDSP